MLDKLQVGPNFHRNFVRDSESCGRRDQKTAEKTSDPNVGKLDKVFDLIQELTKELKGNAGEKGESDSPFKDCVIPDTTGRGGAYLNPSKKEDLAKVADYMDDMNSKFPGSFKSPDNAGGCEGSSWKNELGAKQDNYLNAAEMKEFEKAAKMMEEADKRMDAGKTDKAAGPSDGEGVAKGEGIQQLLEKLISMLQEATDKGDKGNGAEEPKKGESAFKDCVIPSTTGDGGAYLNPSKKEDLSKIAEFMDDINAKAPGTFEKPDNAGGSEGDSWKNELGAKQDNYLNAAEMKEFEKAAQMMESALNADKSDGAGKTDGAGESKSSGGLSDIIKMLEKMLQEMTQKNPVDSLIDKIMNAIKGDGADDAKGAEGSKGAEGAKGAGESQGAEGNQLAEVLKLLLELVKLIQGGGAEDAKGAEGKGGAESSGLNDPALTPQKMDNALVQTGQGDAYANPSEQKTLDKMGEFMDKNTEAFGKPENGGSWADALQGGNNISEKDNGSVQEAAQVMEKLMQLLKMLESDKGGNEQA